MNDATFVLPPYQWTEYLVANPGADAVQDADPLCTFQLSTVQEINIMVNSGIKHMPGNMPEEGTFPAWCIWPKIGWCGDYAITKRSELIKQGWPSDRLLLAEVITAFGDEHAVLVAVLPKGNLVLDNRVTVLRDPKHTGYKPVRSQNSNNPAFWHEGWP